MSKTQILIIENQLDKKPGENSLKVELCSVFWSWRTFIRDLERALCYNVLCLFNNEERPHKLVIYKVRISLSSYYENGEEKLWTSYRKQGIHVHYLFRNEEGTWIKLFAKLDSRVC